MQLPEQPRTLVNIPRRLCTAEVGGSNPLAPLHNSLTRSTEKIDDNRVDLERYVAADTYRFGLTKHLQIQRFTALNNTRQETRVTDLESVQCGLESYRPY
jgi:hypothetical protein